MSFVYWVFEDTSGYVGVSEDPKSRWRRMRAIKKRPKARLVILYEGTREECLKREYQLRPGLRIGWNTLRGGKAWEPPKHGRWPINCKVNIQHTELSPTRFKDFWR